MGHSGSHWHFLSASSGHEITSPILLWRDDIAQCRGWRLFLLLPRLLLFRPPRGGLIPKHQLQNRFSLFPRGEWEQLMLQSEECVAVVSKAFQRKRRTQIDTPERRADRAESLVMMGEVSAGRHALEGTPLAPGTQRILDQLRDPVRRPTSAYALLLPEALLNYHAERKFSLDCLLFAWAD